MAAFLQGVWITIAGVRKKREDARLPAAGFLTFLASFIGENTATAPKHKLHAPVRLLT